MAHSAGMVFTIDTTETCIGIRHGFAEQLSMHLIINLLMNIESE